MNRSLKAYTVIELIVVMLISGITITIAFRGFDIFQTLFKSFKISGTRISDVAFFDRVLSEEIDNANFVYKTEQGIVCLSKEKKTNYIFTDNFIIRENVRSDTFFVKVSELGYFFLKEEKMEVGSLIDKVSILSFNSEDTLYFTYTKMYGADVLMQLEK